MKIAKRCLSVILSLAMIASLLCIPVYATAPCILTASNATATITKTEGQNIDVNIDISGLEGDQGWGALTLYLYYDSTKMTYQKGVPGNTFKEARTAIQDAGGSVSSTVNTSKDTQDANNNGNTEEMCVAIASTATDSANDPARMTGNGTLWTITFKVNEDLESQELPLSLVCLKATVNGDTSAKPTTVDGKVTVNGVAPEIKTVTLSETNVTVAGGNEAGKLVQATATSAKGRNITTQVQWSIEPPTNVIGEESGVTIDKNGNISVGAKAKSGTYKIVAKGITRSSSGGGGTGSISTQSATTEEISRGTAEATLIVKRITPVPTSVSMEDIGDKYIPTNGTTSYQLSAQVIDQYDDVIGKLLKHLQSRAMHPKQVRLNCQMIVQKLLFRQMEMKQRLKLSLLR